MDQPARQHQSANAPLIAVYDPATGIQIGEVADGGKAAVDRAVARARETFRSGVWRHKLARERARILWHLAELIDWQVEELVEIEALNNGMSRFLARNLIQNAAELLRYNAGWCTKIHGESTDLLVQGGVRGGSAEYHAYTLQEPVGVVGLIIPWNGPFFGALQKLAPALAAGCSCVLKPAEETPLTTLRLEALLLEAGVPDGVVNIVTGYGETTGAAIVAHPDIDKVAFTGSTETGKLLVTAAAGNLKRLTLELGGKTPVLIFDDADLTRAIPGAAMGIFINAGQGCVCGSRIYVQRNIYEQVVDGVAAAAKALRLGGSQDPSADIGPLISARQQKRVTGLVSDGQREGATIVTGGKPLDRPGFFFEPTVMTNTNPAMRMIREEIFGPVVAIEPFDDEDSVIAQANDTHYGLAAAVWSRDMGRAHRLAKRMEAGTVYLNCQLANDASIPFGGHKQSGWGYEYGWKGVEGYLQTKSVFADIS